MQGKIKEFLFINLFVLSTSPRVAGDGCRVMGDRWWATGGGDNNNENYDNQ